MKRCSAVVETHGHQSNKIYNSELTIISKSEIKYSDENKSNHKEHG